MVRLSRSDRGVDKVITFCRNRNIKHAERSKQASAVRSAAKVPILLLPITY